MRRVLVLVLSSVFFFCLFRDMTVVKTAGLALAMACAYGLSRLDERYLVAAKYPVIGLCLALAPVLVVYPALRSNQAAAVAATLLAFYGIALLLVTTKDKGREIYKEAAGLSLVYFASAVNLFMTGHCELILSLSIAVLLFLFIIDRVRLMGIVTGYAVACLIFLKIEGVPLLGREILMADGQRYALLACAFLLLLLTFVAFMKRSNAITLLAFFGLLYISVDVLISLGFRLKGVLLYQPFLALFIVSPLAGVIMKGGKGRP